MNEATRNDRTPTDDATTAKASHHLGDPFAEAASQIKHAASDGMREMTDAAHREATRLGQSAREWLDKSKGNALDLATTLRHDAVVMGDRTQHYVREEPVKSMLIAAAAGAALTSLIMLATRRH